MGWHLVASVRAPGAAAVQQTDAFTPPPPPRPSQEIAMQVAGDHLFGFAPPSATAVAPVRASQVHVLGIISTGDAASSWAILDINGNEHSYAAGSTLPDGETLVAVQPDRVTLDQGGNRYSVLWDMQQADMNAHFAIADINAMAAGNFAGTQGNKQALPPPIASTSHEQQLQALRQQFLSKPRLDFTKGDPVQPAQQADN